jgi:hypothetical protein
MSQQSALAPFVSRATEVVDAFFRDALSAGGAA